MTRFLLRGTSLSRSGIHSSFLEIVVNHILTGGLLRHLAQPRRSMSTNLQLIGPKLVGRGITETDKRYFERLPHVPGTNNKMHQSTSYVLLVSWYLNFETRFCHAKILPKVKLLFSYRYVTYQDFSTRFSGCSKKILTSFF